MTTATLVTEDDLYRTSTQYRLWSFSPESLASLRQQTHTLALDRAQQSHHHQNAATTPQDYLTPTDELRLVQRYSDQLRTTSDHFKWPVNVKATAVQYLRRFYLSNSCLTYPPKEIYKTVLFLACKTEATHMPLSEYARRISTEPEVVLAPEYKIMQALRFTLDVRQPYRGLKGALMEMLNLADGRVGEVDGVEMERRGARELQGEMLALTHPAKGSSRTPWIPNSSDGKMGQKELVDRVQAAYAAAKGLLDGAALLTDVYFLYTPSQILLAALLLADEPLTSFYLSTKLPVSSDIRPKILATVRACADVLGAFSEKDVMSKDERAVMEDRLDKCRDPTTRDLVKAHAAAKRGTGGEDEEEKARKKKAAREKSAKEGEDLFGPSLSTTNGGKG